jgi:hypothetical protein
MTDLICDVLVVGGGIAGIAAATAAGRQGAKTILIESKTFIGGVPATGYCLHNFIAQGGRQVVFGLAQEMVDRLMEMGGAVGHVPYQGFVCAVTPVDGEMFRFLSNQLLDEAGVQMIVGIMAVGAEVDGQGWIQNVAVATKSGLSKIRAKIYVDASGDGDLAVFAGASYSKGDAKTGKMQPVSMIIRCYATDNQTMAKEISVVTPAMAKRRDYPDPIPVYFNGHFGRWNDYVLENGIFPNKDHKVFLNTVWPNHINVNTSAVTGIDGTDTVDLSRGTVQLTRQIYKITKFLREFVPGFKVAYFAPSSWAQVRETRRIKGLYEIGDQDIIQGKKCADTIGKICFPVDIHDPDTGQARFHEIGDDGTFDIPFRALVPEGLANLVVAGRCISASQYAQGATRNHAPCLVTGEAAGVAASLAAKRNCAIPELDIHQLQQTLLANKVFLGEAFSPAKSAQGAR